MIYWVRNIFPEFDRPVAGGGVFKIERRYIDVKFWVGHCAQKCGKQIGPYAEEGEVIKAALNAGWLVRRQKAGTHVAVCAKCRNKQYGQT